MTHPFIPFWRSEPLTVPASALLQLCLAAHAACARRPNISTQVLLAAAQGSGRFETSVGAALATLGGLHAPLINTYILLHHADPAARARELVGKRKRVPGWGGDFQGEEADPIWRGTAGLLAEQFPEIHAKLEAVTAVLHQAGKAIQPNASAYTAATGLALQMPRHALPWIFVQGRLGVWSGLILETLNHHNAH